MTSEHLNDPLDYLYEELPPERMAEVREHLAACPECREELREIRETVKAYRRAPRPAPPPGLAARAAARALRAAEEIGEPDNLPSEESGAAAKAVEFSDVQPMDGASGIDSNEAEFHRLKAEVLGEKRHGWRLRLFHPAWTVAASVLFVLAVLIHVSPRNNRWSSPEGPGVSPAQPRETAPSAPAPLPKPLPAPPPASPRAQPESDFQPVPPTLRQAEKLEMQLERESAAPAPAPALPSRARQTPPAELADGAFGESDTVSIPALDTSSSAQSEKAEQLYRGVEKSHPSIPEAAASLRPPPAAAFSEKMAEMPAASDNAAELPDVAVGLAPITLPASPEETVQAPMVIEMFDGSNAPRLIERPTPVDVEQSILNLSTLAGMQIALGEFDEARKTIELLARLDSEKARNLDDLLRNAQRSAAAAASPSSAGAAPYESDMPAEAETATSGSVPAAAPPTPRSIDKYYMPISPASPGYAPQEAPAAGDSPPEPPPATSEPVSSAADAIPASAFDFPVSSSQPAIAPDVPKRSPDAVPPTLWESTRSGRRSVHREADGGSRRPFTTDPYYRDR